MVKTIYKHEKSYYKQFFRELLLYRNGKVNMLKNKIIRKYIDRHMKIDKVLLAKL